jgi:hypothetical protein
VRRAVVALTATASAETLLERGNYLVNAVMGCDGCYTPRPGGVFDMSKRLSGGSQSGSLSIDEGKDEGA